MSQAASVAGGPWPSGVVLRPAELRDLDALVAIEAAVFPGDRLSRKSFRRLMGRPSAAMIVVKQDGALAGYALVLFRTGSPIARLYSIAVAPGQGGRGLGRLLLNAAETIAAERGCHGIRLEVRDDNAAAIALYEASGYREIGRHRRYYDDDATAIRFAKSVIDAAKLAPPVTGPPPARSV